MSDDARPNIYTDEWERTIEEKGFGVRASRVGAAAGARDLGMALYELMPGKRNFPYHTHHGIEEAVVVLSGTPTLRTPEGERELAEGEVVVFPAGPKGLHQLSNKTDAPARVLMVSNKARADVVEYPDSKRIYAMGGEWGTPESVDWRLSTENEVGYFEGESG
jgi:uncharacterized cupin superfamily protein